MNYPEIILNSGSKEEIIDKTYITDCNVSDVA